MTRYKLSARGLESAFRKLVSAGAVTPEELHERCTEGEDTVIIDDLRQSPRVGQRAGIPIYDRNDFSIRGRIRDIADRGVGISGIETAVGEVRTFVITPDEYLELEPIVFDATCRWVRPGPDSATLAGFEITSATEETVAELRRLLGRLSGQ
jgi:hypothetical protein